MLQGDVWYHSWQAGGGYGDPLTREPSQVFEDLMRGIISKKAAKDIYGVVISEEEKLNIKETKNRSLFVKRKV